MLRIRDWDLVVLSLVLGTLAEVVPEEDILCPVHFLSYPQKFAHSHWVAADYPKKTVHSRQSKHLLADRFLGSHFLSVCPAVAGFQYP